MLQDAREATRRADDHQLATTPEETTMQKLMLAVAAAGLAVLGSAADADEYPSKPVTLVAVFAPGSASDTICRVIAQPLSLALKESVIVENRPGANGALAAFYVARSAPDGYTLLMGTNSPLSAAPFLMRNLSYDPVKDFEPVSRVGSFTLMLVVNPSLPVKSVKELIDYAKAHPGKLSFASANTSGIVAGETLAHWAGLDMLHVPYKSTPPALQDVLAGVGMRRGEEQRQPRIDRLALRIQKTREGGMARPGQVAEQRRGQFRHLGARDAHDAHATSSGRRGCGRNGVGARHVGREQG